MPFPSLCTTSRKSQAKHNCTLCKQHMPNIQSVLPTFYLQYQLCSPRISSFQRQKGRGQIKYCLAGAAGANGLCHCTLCFSDRFHQERVCNTHTHAHTQLSPCVSPACVVIECESVRPAEVGADQNFAVRSVQIGALDFGDMTPVCPEQIPKTSQTDRSVGVDASDSRRARGRNPTNERYELMSCCRQQLQGS